MVDAPFIESVLLPVRAGLGADFEAAFAQAEPLIMRARGYLGHTLRRGVERPGTYLLTVGWNTVEDHERGFRGSGDYAEWSHLLHRCYDPFPSVLHYGEDLAAQTPEPS
jgi:heme-degrading monooxygenase HmoA